MLADKSGQLAEGSTTLLDGTKQLADGTTTLSEKLAEAAGEVDINPTQKNYEMAGSPVEVDKSSTNTTTYQNFRMSYL